MEIGKYSYGMPQVHWEGNGAKLVIGKFCSIAGGVHIYLGGNHRTDWITTYPFGHVHQNVFPGFDGKGHPSTKGDVIIGNDVWIADNVTIMSGVVIGDGAIIANNSHVVKDVEPYTMVGGNPAKLIRYRFSKEQIQRLLEIRWWDWSEERINAFAARLCSGDIEGFLREVDGAGF